MLGTDTAIGKTYVTVRLAAGLRHRGDQVWLHKPIACGGWQGGAWPDGTAEDARSLAAQLGDGQPAETLCPVQFPGECSPFLAAAALGQAVPIAQLVGTMRQLASQTGELGAWLLVETAGGLLSPIAAERATNADLLVAGGLPAVLVTSTRLGTQNHTALTVAVARQRGIRLLGLVLNQTVPGSSADRATISDELSTITGLRVLATLGKGDSGDGGLAEALAECLV
ncbi:ATP-dependent dethiobiotin synthetase BioD [Planctomycetota bacterium]|nr:ATP-dependent dethiobiotin synthetase BioD [Planctomycetota bacterium]